MIVIVKEKWDRVEDVLIEGDDGLNLRVEVMILGGGSDIGRGPIACGFRRRCSLWILGDDNVVCATHSFFFFFFLSGN